MIVKQTIVNTKSVFIYKTAITKYEDTVTLENLILEKNVSMYNVVEVRAGFGNELFAIDQENLSEISLVISMP